MKTTNRFRAFAMHLAASGVVALTCAALVFMVWYPGPLAAASGVTGIFLMLLGIDVVVGPLITLIVFNTAKKELKRDLLVVLALQVAALSYGLHAVFTARPAYLVFAADRFDTVYANDLTDEKLAEADLQFRRIPWTGPEAIAAHRPDDSKARTELLFRSLTGGDDLAQMPKQYVPLASEKALILSRGRPLKELLPLNLHEQGKVNAVIARHAGRPGGVLFLPVKGKVQDCTAIIDAGTAELVELVALKPWA